MKSKDSLQSWKWREANRDEDQRRVRGVRIEDFNDAVKMNLEICTEYKALWEQTTMGFMKGIVGVLRCTFHMVEAYEGE